ncbi:MULTISPECIES: AraC family transcriptional regulator [unclassified Pseudomonas]|jgi:AraC-like DNA-binding protein|uniref:AraC-like transcriptional regulator QhpR n=1 Tax=unclassified Pseudomonas TaxID=196821 RepID=UPI00129EA914|nr:MULTISPECIES: AraC family transcriptional regulator [unclassified Pseudomonas]MDH4656837.1 AraC family transcriptional regulator [Pseudomonas sp. BN606]MRK24036.1 AraC family transcriptional regulator [Pseudomonas sp. JG-B]
MSRLKHTVYTEALLQHYGDLFRPHLAAVGLSEDVLARPDAKIPLNQYNALLEVAAERSDAFLGLRLGLGLFGEPLKTSLLGGVGHVVRSAADVRTMLECTSRYIVVHAQANELTWRLQGGCLEVTYRLTDPSVLHRRQDAEFAIGTLYSRLREYTGGKYAPLRVEFEHPQPADISLHNEVFQCPLKFGQPANVIVWPGEMLDEPLITADLRLFQTLLPGLEEERRRRLADTDLTTRIGMVIEANLASGRVGLEQVAAELCLSKRTLQRRLQELDLEFAELVEEIRQALAIELVRQSPKSLTEIAQQLGYNEASSFTRAFRRWTGLSPREFRQQGAK